MAKLSPIESEFVTSDDEAEAYDTWLRAKIEKAMASEELSIPHDEVTAMARAIIEKHRIK